MHVLFDGYLNNRLRKHLRFVMFSLIKGKPSRNNMTYFFGKFMRCYSAATTTKLAQNIQIAKLPRTDRCSSIFNQMADVYRYSKNT